MITIGIDTHKRVHQAVAVDDRGAEVARWRGGNHPDAWNELMAWMVRLGADRQVGIEGAWNYGRGLAQHLVIGGETVYEVNPRWTSAMRRAARRRGKSDRLDALAVALCVRQEGPGLPRVGLEDETVILQLLTGERENALAEATRLRNQIHAHLMQLDPQYQDAMRSIKTRRALDALKAYTTDDDRPVQRARAEIVRALAQRLELALSQAEEIGKTIRELAAARYEALTRICGVNLLTAGILAGILGPGRRFRSDAELAAYAGAAPLEASSAAHVRHRLNRTGDRRLNAVLYRIALTQAHYSPEGKAYLARRMSEGKTRREAVRALKRYIVRAIYRIWTEIIPLSANPTPCATCGCT